MPNYNDASTLPEAIEAVLSQSWKPDEFIIIDDASTDDSVAIIQRYANHCSTIRFLQNPTNRGVLTSVNRGLDAATGDYFYSTSSNDKVLPGFFEKSMRMLLEHPEAGVSCSDFFFEYPDSTRVREPKAPFSRKSEYLSPSEIIARMSRKHFYVPHGCTAIYKRSSLVKAGGYFEELGSAADWFVIHVEAFRDGICYIPEPLAINRLMPESFSASHAKDPPRQKKIFSFGRLLLETPDYKDVSEAFQRSGALLGFLGEKPWDWLQKLLLQPKYWRHLGLFLLRRAWMKLSS